MEKLILIGAGGHAKSVADSIDKSKYELYGFIDSKKKGTHLGLPIWGTELEDMHIKSRLAVQWIMFQEETVTSAI